MLPGTFVLFVVIVSVQSAEPECSRFHYEEQTLEKMIRQEIHVERMKAELGETKNQVELALEALKQERESFKTEREEMKKAQNLEKEKLVQELGETKKQVELDLEALKQERESFETKMEEMKKAQNLEKEKLVRELDEIKGKTLIPGIAFQAKVLKNDKFTSGETLVFTNTVFDFGNGYNNQTGLFTATKSGLYLFSLHLCLYSADAYLYYDVFTQERTVFHGKFVADGGKYYPCLSSQVLINMQHGDTVGVKMKSSSISTGNIVLYQHYGSHECVFSGVLINSNV